MIHIPATLHRVEFLISSANRIKVMEAVAEVKAAACRHAANRVKGRGRCGLPGSADVDEVTRALPEVITWWSWSALLLLFLLRVEIAEVKERRGRRSHTAR